MLGSSSICLTLGSDIEKNYLVLKAGELIDCVEIGLLATVGLTSVKKDCTRYQTELHCDFSKLQESESLPGALQIRTARRNSISNVGVYKRNWPREEVEGEQEREK